MINKNLENISLVNKLHSEFGKFFNSSLRRQELDSDRIKNLSGRKRVGQLKRLPLKVNIAAKYETGSVQYMYIKGGRCSNY